MKLREYLENRGETQIEFAARAGVRQATVSAWCTGKATPELTMALKLQDLTGGLVTPSDFAKHRPSPRT